jgi:hypothetical protein
MNDDNEDTLKAIAQAAYGQPEPNQQLKCPKCNQGRLYLPPVQFTVVNQHAYSMVVFVHAAGYTCGKCDAYYIAAINPQTVQFEPAIVPAERPAAENLVQLPPPGLKLAGH